MMKPAMRAGVSKRRKLQVLERDGYSCRYCGKEGDASDFWVDHVLPVFRGGTSDYANLVTACMQCNLRKGSHGGGWLVEQAPEHLRVWWRDFLQNPPQLPPTSDAAAAKQLRDSTPSEVPEAVREYMAAIGSKRTPAKAEASRRNVAKARAARVRDPLSLPCLCGGCPNASKWTCPRGRLLKQREKAAQQRAAEAETVEPVLQDELASAEVTA